MPLPTLPPTEEFIAFILTLEPSLSMTLLEVSGSRFLLGVCVSQRAVLWPFVSASKPCLHWAAWGAHTGSLVMNHSEIAWILIACFLFLWVTIVGWLKKKIRPSFLGHNPCFTVYVSGFFGQGGWDFLWCITNYHKLNDLKYISYFTVVWSGVWAQLNLVFYLESLKTVSSRYQLSDVSSLTGEEFIPSLLRFLAEFLCGCRTEGPSLLLAGGWRLPLGSGRLKAINW